MGVDQIACGVCGQKQPVTLDGWTGPHFNESTGAPCGNEIDRKVGGTRPTGASARPKPSRKRRSSKPNVQKKLAKPKALEDYCPRCRAFVLMVKAGGKLTVAEHSAKRGGRCAMSGRSFKPRPQDKRDAMEFRVSGSFGGGKRH